MGMITRDGQEKLWLWLRFHLHGAVIVLVKGSDSPSTHICQSCSCTNAQRFSRVELGPKRGYQIMLSWKTCPCSTSSCVSMSASLRFASSGERRNQIPGEGCQIWNTYRDKSDSFASVPLDDGGIECAGIDGRSSNDILVKRLSTNRDIRS